MKTQFLLFCACLFLLRCGPTINDRMVGKMIDGGIQTEAGQPIMIPGFGSKEVNIFYLVRHAEKELNVENPGLTAEGVQRAKKLSEILADVNLEGIYSTNFNRTINTAAPTAKQQQIEVNSYDHRKQGDLVAMLKPQKGKHFLIVGHSNSIPSLLNLFQDNTVYPAIDESVYDNFFVVVNAEENVDVYELKY